eukprot:SM000045S16211  [mRNA]  locus=s45:343562:344321:+ [translate_table: standard]
MAKPSCVPMAASVVWAWAARIPALVTTRQAPVTTQRALVTIRLAMAITRLAMATTHPALATTRLRLGATRNTATRIGNTPHAIATSNATHHYFCCSWTTRHAAPLTPAMRSHCPVSIISVDICQWATQGSNKFGIDFEKIGGVRALSASTEVFVLGQGYELWSSGKRNTNCLQCERKSAFQPY